MNRKNILYAEDYAPKKDRILSYFESFLPGKVSVEVFDNGRSLEKRIQKGVEGVDLIILDEEMSPGLNGNEIIAKYARKEGFNKVPFIFYSSVDKESGEQAVRNGAFAYIQKDGHKKEFISAVKRALKMEFDTLSKEK